MSGSDSDSDGAAPAGSWLSSLTWRQAENLSRFGLYVPPSAKLLKPWHIRGDGLATLGPGATIEERRRHPGGAWNKGEAAVFEG